MYPLNMFVQETVLFLISPFLNLKIKTKRKQTNEKQNNGINSKTKVILCYWKKYGGSTYGTLTDVDPLLKRNTCIIAHFYC